MATIRATDPRVPANDGVALAPAPGLRDGVLGRIVRRRAALAAVGWLLLLAVFSVFAPLLANGHPLILRELDSSGGTTRTWSPLLAHLRVSDVALISGVLLGVPWIVAAPRGNRASRFLAAAFGAVLVAAVIAMAALLTHIGDANTEAASPPNSPLRAFAPALAAAVFIFGVAVWLRVIPDRRTRILVAAASCAIGVLSLTAISHRPLEVFDYIPRENRGVARATYPLTPWSPMQRFPALDRLPPLSHFGPAMSLPPSSPAYSRIFLLGTDGLGQDVLSQVLWASRLAISIGLVSTGIAVLIGVTLGAIMGYFGGWIDLLLYRVVEVFMAIPLLFLLIVTAAVLPASMRTTYTMMAIIGCFTWTGAARFTRAEFLKLRDQDFVQSARSAGLSLRSILFRHMLPNGVTPVLVDASFAIAAAIAIEATLSFLGLGPVDQPSWGKLLAGAIGSDGKFRWWLAAFPGAMIFLTVLSYNVVGEAVRDAIDPKLARAVP